MERLKYTIELADNGVVVRGDDTSLDVTEQKEMKTLVLTLTEHCLKLWLLCVKCSWIHKRII